MQIEDWIKFVAERISAINSSEKNYWKIMQKVYNVDRYWESFRKECDTKLTIEQKKQVEDFWGRYSFAYKNSGKAQEYFSSLSGRFNPMYIPDGLMAYYLFRYYDSPEYHTAFHDKNYREEIFKGYLCTPAIVHRVKKYFYNASFVPITYDDAISILFSALKKEEKLIVKPTPGGGGNKITFIRSGDSKQKISDIIDSFEKDDVVIEKVIRAHNSYEIANPSSLNSLRIITHFTDKKVDIIAVIFRMGAVGNEVDNFTQGGVICRVDEEGRCSKFGFDHHGNKYDKHPNGFEFQGHKLYAVDEAIALARELHFRIPQFRQMSWDIAIDQNGKPCLIEMNPRGECDLYQIFGILPFGDKTKEVLDDYLLTMFYKRKSCFAWDYKEYHDHIILTKCFLAKKNVYVPKEINGKDVTGIEAGCFESGKIKKIIIPGNIKDIASNIINGEHSIEVERLTDNRGITIPKPLNVTGKAGERWNQIKWTAASGVTNYRIYRMKKGGERKFIKQVGETVTFFTDYSVIVGDTYYYYIRSFDSKYGMHSDWVGPIAICTRG